MESLKDFCIYKLLVRWELSVIVFNLRSAFLQAATSGVNIISVEEFVIFVCEKFYFTRERKLLTIPVVKFLLYCRLIISLMVLLIYIR